MKNFLKRHTNVLFLAGFALVIVGTVALETQALTPDPQQSRFPQWFQQRVFIGSKASGVASTSSNGITRVLGTNRSWNFAMSGTGGGAGAAGCESSEGITVTGARLGDTCVVVADVVAGVGGGDGAASPPTSSVFTCHVSAADTVVIKHCSVAASNPPDAGYTIRLFSHQ